ncbi:MAG: hypothetical protein CMK07_07865 [Ponticaulis sp.]|nr:hypothetical protein [Ponticaulis sp.]
MKKLVSGLVIGAALIASPMAFAGHHEGDEAKYSTAKSTIDVLMADDAALAILKDEIPDVVNNDQIAMAAGMTLHDIQMYAPDMLTDEKLATIDTKLAEIE